MRCRCLRGRAWRLADQNLGEERRGDGKVSLCQQSDGSYCRVPVHRQGQNRGFEASCRYCKLQEKGNKLALNMAAKEAIRCILRATWVPKWKFWLMRPPSLNFHFGTQVGNSGLCGRQACDPRLPGEAVASRFGEDQIERNR